MSMSKSLAAVSAAALLVLAGCELPGLSSGTVNPALEGEEVTFFNESGAAGCAVGALAGALIGIAATDSNHRVQGAMIGAAAGCGLGLTGNYLLNKARASYKNEEDQIDYIASEVAADNAKLKKLNSNVQWVIDEDKKKLAQLEKDLTAGKISEDNMYRQKADMDANYQVMQKNLTEINTRITAYQEARSGFVDSAGGSGSMTAGERRKLAELDQQIAALKRSRADLEAYIDEYAAVRNAVGVSA